MSPAASPTYRRRRGKRNVMRKLRIDFLSAVDQPAQEGAQALIMKRKAAKPKPRPHPKPRLVKQLDEHPHADQVLEHVTKFDDSVPVVMTSSVDGHSHLAWVNARAGTTTWQTSAGSESGHDHPFMLSQSEDGSFNLAVGDSEGHSHDVDARDVTAAFAAVALSKQHEEDHPMADPTATTKSATEVEALEQNLTLARLFNGLDDSEREHFADLDDAGKRSFVTKSHEDRQAVIAKAKPEDPEVVYTADDGTAYTKADDPRHVALARKADGLEKRANASEETLEQERLEKRASDELPHLAGTAKARARLLKSVEAIEDEGERKEAMEVLASGNTAAGQTFEERGSSEGSTPEPGSAADQLDKAVKKHAEDHKVSFAKAMRDFTETDEGRRLYADTLS